MADVNSVSETALLTLRSRVIESERKDPVITDPMARDILEGIDPLISGEVRERILKRKLRTAMTMYIALRSDIYDRYTKAFLEKYPDGLVINLGCGLDTRYWRAVNDPQRYIELDLPEMIDLKKEILGDRIPYEMIGCSVLEDEWIERIATRQSEKILFLAEGLLMYLPPDDVKSLIKKISEKFSRSQFVIEVVKEKYTRGLWKKMVERKMRRSAGSSAGSSFNFGVKNAKEIESYGNNIKVLEEWSYLEDGRVRPSILKFFGKFKTFTRSQWTIKGSIG
jgi:methyltransferase (TIGR00027 family)